MPLSVIDIWGWITPDTQVCFRAAGGSIKFVDTNASPRTIYDLPVFYRQGMICTTIQRAGQVALVSGPPSPTATPVRPGGGLSGCMVRTNYMLNLRDAPAGEKIGAVAYDVTLTALARTPGWFMVDNLGQYGWIAAKYVAPIGTCG